MCIPFLTTAPQFRGPLLSRILTGLGTLLCLSIAYADTAVETSPRSRDCIDARWRFALGHATDPEQDFGYGTFYHSDLSKAGYGDGPAAADFDDRAWRLLDLPHDWAVEAPFDSKASRSHGYKAIGRGYPERSVGWYRKKIFVPSSDLGRRIFLQFDGAFRATDVWINGFLLGREPSGYIGFDYDVTDYVNYGGENTIAVRVDASKEEGWFYEGAGIYRHVWWVKTAPLHVPRWGTFVQTELNGDQAALTVATTVTNASDTPAEFSLAYGLITDTGAAVASAKKDELRLAPRETREFRTQIAVAHPELWTLERPTLHRLKTEIRRSNSLVDTDETTFGIRTVELTADRGFLLNGLRVQLKGTNIHQDAAGVGVAVPDALHEYRIRKLKEFGSNAIRTAHSPPAPELLDACDRLGMLVMDETRLMGVTAEPLSVVDRMIRRDRNHPSVFLWSLGNEEWGLEGNIKGERVTRSMEAFAKPLDPTRRYTVAISGGWGGTARVVDVMGVNYIRHGSTDEHHAEFPQQPIVGTEESTTRQTRGVYFDDPERGYLAPLLNASSGGNVEVGWKHYASRPYLAGVFFWTGFDFRGEPNPYGWPQVATHCGLLDQCGFPKDSFFYLKSWWTDEPTLHLFPHWNWQGKEGQNINVWCYSNCDAVELFLNGQSLGKQKLEKNGHLEWNVSYAPGVLSARGYRAGTVIASDEIKTTGMLSALKIDADRTRLRGENDLAVVSISVVDENGREVPTADPALRFTIAGPGRIRAVANGDPSSHEHEQFLKERRTLTCSTWKVAPVSQAEVADRVRSGFDDTSWTNRRTAAAGLFRDFPNDKPWMYRGVIEAPSATEGETLTLLTDALRDGERLFLNGEPITLPKAPAGVRKEMVLSRTILRPGKNILAAVVLPSTPEAAEVKERLHGPGPAYFLIERPAPPWTRQAFNGKAQVLVQATGEAGEIVLTIESAGLPPQQVRFSAQAVP